MEIYADLFVLINCLCDGTVTALTALLLKRRVKKRRILAASLLGGLYALVYLLLYPSPLLLALLSVLTTLFMVLAAFGFHGPAAFCRALFVFYLMSLAAGGMVGILNNLFTYLLPSRGLSLLLLLLLLFALFIFGLFAGKIFLLEQKRRVATLCFSLEGKDYRLKGLLDSGNLLTDPFSGSPAVLVDPTVFERPPFCDRVLHIHTPAGKRELPAFLPEKAEINGIPRKICIALCPPPKGGFGGTPALLPRLQ